MLSQEGEEWRKTEEESRRKERMMNGDCADRKERRIGGNGVKNEEMMCCKLKRKDGEGSEERCGSFL